MLTLYDSFLFIIAQLQYGFFFPLPLILCKDAFFIYGCLYPIVFLTCPGENQSEYP
jgi:hypothetical protein